MTFERLTSLRLVIVQLCIAVMLVTINRCDAVRQKLQHDFSYLDITFYILYISSGCI